MSPLHPRLPFVRDPPSSTHAGGWGRVGPDSEENPRLWGGGVGPRHGGVTHPREVRNDPDSKFRFDPRTLVPWAPYGSVETRSQRTQIQLQLLSSLSYYTNLRKDPTGRDSLMNDLFTYSLIEDSTTTRPGPTRTSSGPRRHPPKVREDTYPNVPNSSFGSSVDCLRDLDDPRTLSPPTDPLFVLELSEALGTPHGATLTPTGVSRW